MKLFKKLISVAVSIALLLPGTVIAAEPRSVRVDLTSVPATKYMAGVSVEVDAQGGKYVFIKPEGEEAWGEFAIPSPGEGLYTVSLEMKSGPGRGIYALYVNDVKVGEEFNLYAKNLSPVTIEAGNVTLGADESIRVRLVYRGKGEKSLSGGCAIRAIVFAERSNDAAAYDFVDKKILSTVYEHPVLDRNTERVMREFYVDPIQGSDSGDGSIAHPFRTIGAAKAEVQKYNSDMTGDIVVYLRGGTYYPETKVRQEQLYSPAEDGTLIPRETIDVTQSNLQFDVSDSGSNGYYVVYKAYEGEVPVISGERVIDGWTLYDAEKKIYSAPAHGINTRQLFIDGKRAIRATSGFSADNFNKAFANCTVTEEGLITTDDYFLNWNNLEQVECVFTNKEYWSPRIRISGAVRGEDGLVHIAMQEPAWSNVLLSRKTKGLAGGPATIENAYELIDEENEWYLDQKTDTFFYKPAADQRIDDVTITAGVIEELLMVCGKNKEQKVKNIVFDGIVFRGTTWLRPSSDNGFADCQAGLIRETEEYANQEGAMPVAALTVQYANNIGIANCRINGMGSNGVYFSDGCRDCIIYGCEVRDISGSGIAVGGVQVHQRTAYDEERVINCDVMYNIVKDCAKEYHAAVGIMAGLPVDTDISHNEISQCMYTGIHVGWGFYGDDELAAMSQLMMNMRIQNNLIYDTTLLLTDGAAIYTRGHMATEDNPNIISGNYALRGNGKVSNAIYYDCDTTHWHSVDNVAEDLVSAYFSHVWNTTNTFKNIYGDINSKRAAIFNAEDVNDRYPSLQRNIVIDDYCNFPPAAIDIIKHAGLPEAYRGMRTEKAGEMFRLVPKDRIIELDTGDTAKMEFEAYDIYNNKLDTSNLKLRYSVVSIIDYFFQYKAQNGMQPVYASGTDGEYHISVDEDGTIKVLGIPSGVVHVEGELNGIKRYTTVSVMDKVSRNVQLNLPYTAVGTGVTNFYSNIEKNYSHICDFSEGSTIEYTIPTPATDGVYNIALWAYRGPSRGMFKIHIDGEDTGHIVDFYNATNGSGSSYVKYNLLGRTDVTGKDTIKVKFECVGKNEQSSDSRLSLFDFYFVPHIDLAGTIALESGNSYAHVNGWNVLLDKDNDRLAPFVENGRMMVPIRFVAEIMGADVAWDETTRQATIRMGNNEVVIAQDSTEISVNGVEQEIDVAAQVREGRLFIPIRAVSEALGQKVHWYSPGLALIGENADLLKEQSDVYSCLSMLHIR